MVRPRPWTLVDLLVDHSAEALDLAFAPAVPSDQRQLVAQLSCDANRPVARDTGENSSVAERLIRDQFLSKYLPKD